MLRHLVDILTKRPPLTQTIWEKDKANLDWWEHKEVYPVFPIMLLIHLFIPLRGAQLRNLCRDRSFELDDFGNIETIIVNTDKNVNRSSLQEIPNVWSELEILSDFLQWHKAYFPHLPEVVYNDDENSVWDNIIPTMITPKSFKPISQHTHMNYFKRVLTQYQIETNSVFIEEGSENRVNVVWMKDGTEIPNTIEELNLLNDGFFSSIASSYDIHSLRVTGATRYLEAGLGIPMVMKLTGHSSPDMLLNVYNKLEMSEKKKLLSTAVNKVFLTDEGKTSDNLRNFILDELPNNYDFENPKEVNRAITDNGLFSMQRKSSSESVGGTKISLGTSLAKSSHPSTWTPMIFGICPGTRCPDGRENKCSLCPYLITGRLFLDGVIHQANLKLINFYRLSQEIHEEQNSNYENSGKSEGIDLLFEEVLGWFEIINKIEEDLASSADGLPAPLSNKGNSITGKAIEPPEFSYLKTNYNAMKMGIEKDAHGVAILMIKAFNISRKNGYQEIDSILNDEKKTIDWLMAIYTDKKQSNMLSSFVKQLND